MRKKTLSVICIQFITCMVFAQTRLAEPAIPLYPTLEDPKSFSMIMVPDPQSYVKFAANQPLFELQTAWIAQNIKRLNIMTALFTGDMVEQNNKLVSAGLPRHVNGDQTSRQQWEAISRGLARLDNHLPYIVCQGNHDVGHLAAENRYSMMPNYIYPERNNKFAHTLVATGTDYNGIHTMENAAFEFHDKNWGKLLIIAFEFAPRDEALEWAKALISSGRYAKHKVIILLHSFLTTDGKHVEHENYKLTPRNWGRSVWEKLVYPSKNIVMVLCGHNGTPPKFNDVKNVNYQSTTCIRTDKAADGRNVVQMMFNSQIADGEWNGNGGDCWLRILEFKPDGKTIGVRTFSPLFALSKLTKHLAWRTADYDQFSITIE